mgnify:CR=1 FL=1|tara:strand:- start:2746 stop:3207 length:462 start_codon:yes stop_codon:yes gene_type:complete
MEHGDKVMLTELVINAEVDANTIKNEIIISEIAELIKTEEHVTKPHVETMITSVKDISSSNRQDPQNVKPSPPQPTNEQKLPAMVYIRNWVGSNLKYIGIACLAVVIQMMLYHIPQINQKMLEISPNYSTQMKMFFSFVLVYWAQKEIHRIFP